METPIHTKQLFLVCAVVFSMFYRAAWSCNCNVDNLHELGIEDGHIPDQAMTASSILDGNHGPGRGRLNQGPTGSQGTAWCAKEEDEDQYLQVDLIFNSKVTHIATQGQNDPPTNVNGSNITSWVRQYILEYSSDGEQYNSYIYQKDVQNFKGNTDGVSISCCDLPYPLVTQYLRFRPVSWQTRICLRVGVYGETNVNASTLVSDNQITYHEYWWWPLFWVLLIILVFFLILVIFTFYRIRNSLNLNPRTIKSEKKRGPSFYTNPVVPNAHKPKNGTVIIAMKDSVKSKDENPYEIPEDEVQEVVAHFDDDGSSNRHGVTHFSVTDEDEDEPPARINNNNDNNNRNGRDRGASNRGRGASIGSSGIYDTIQ